MFYFLSRKFDRNTPLVYSLERGSGMSRWASGKWAAFSGVLRLLLIATQRNHIPELLVYRK